MLAGRGRSRHKVVNKEHSTVTLQDVAGIEEAKDEIGEIIEFLKSPKKFQRLGGRVPRGVLLIGSPAAVPIGSSQNVARPGHVCSSDSSLTS